MKTLEQIYMWPIYAYGKYFVDVKFCELNFFFPNSSNDT